MVVDVGTPVKKLGANGVDKRMDESEPDNAGSATIQENRAIDPISCRTLQHHERHIVIVRSSKAHEVAQLIKELL